MKHGKRVIVFMTWPEGTAFYYVFLLQPTLCELQCGACFHFEVVSKVAVIMLMSSQYSPWACQRSRALSMRSLVTPKRPLIRNHNVRWGLQATCCAIIRSTTDMVPHKVEGYFKQIDKTERKIT
eukprot:1147489-Amphidinium_carterae.1